MTKEEILEVPVVEKPKKVKPQVSEDSLLSTFPIEQKEDEVVEEKENVVEPKNEVDDIMNRAETKVIEEIANMEEVSDTQETGKTVELADNILSSSETYNSTSNNTNLPADPNSYVKIIKEKLVAWGKVALGVFEKIGDFVENIFKKWKIRDEDGDIIKNVFKEGFIKNVWQIDM